MPRGNEILEALTADQQRALRARGTDVPLVQRVTLVEPGEPLTAIFFPSRGAISLVTLMSDGESVEAGLIGREGMLGPVGPMADAAVPWRAVVQMPGEALAVPVSALAGHAELVAALQPLERRYQTSLLWIATLSIACNRFHSLEQRCARWLLMLRDRAAGDTLQTTHEFLGEMLGARRQSVTRTLNRLAKAGLIASDHRSEVRIVDRHGLERTACECYRRIGRIGRVSTRSAPRAAGASPARVGVTRQAVRRGHRNPGVRPRGFDPWTDR